MRMLLALSLVALSLAFTSQAQTCHIQSCVAEGDECLPASDCTNGFGDACQKQCPLNTACIATNPDGILRCIQSTEGYDCDPLLDNCGAVYGPVLTCSALRVCVPINSNLLPNDFCESNEDCAVVTGATSGQCLDGRCRGNIEAVQCGNDADCNPGLYCSGGTCTAQVASGASCTGDNQCLGLSLACGPQGTCQQVFTGSLQTACDDDLDCGSGLGCASGICNDVSSVSAVVGADCSTDPSICSSTGLLGCACNELTGSSQCVAAVNECTEELTSLFACGDANQCHQDSRSAIFFGGFSSTQDGNCLYHECRGDYDALVDCLNDGSLVPATVDPSCAPVGRNAASQLSFLLW